MPVETSLRRKLWKSTNPAVQQGREAVQVTATRMARCVCIVTIGAHDLVSNPSTILSMPQRMTINHNYSYIPLRGCIKGNRHDITAIMLT